MRMPTSFPSNGNKKRSEAEKENHLISLMYIHVLRVIKKGKNTKKRKKKTRANHRTFSFAFRSNMLFKKKPKP